MAMMQRGESPQIRLYQPEDRSELYRIASDTAFFGDPIEAYLDDRRIFCDTFYRYYVEYEQEHVFVACLGKKIVGFLAGSIATEQQERIFHRILLPSVIRRVLLGRYRIGTRTFHYLWRLLRAGLTNEIPVVDLNRYPAHLHINIDREWRGCGFGKRLMESYLNQLVQLKIPGVHLLTNSENKAACQLYEKFGFQLLDEQLTKMWEGWVDHPVFNRVYGLRLK